ncbi:LysR family transcriptional regulator [Microbulbifer sp. CNSA002]|uniref:LysR family transcriptional regulator n=1 Tax=unclassified Microbulbifer TaxID=2619833 RepID=UPI0039B43CCC
MSKFTQYESFVAVVDSGSIRLAADSLNKTPSALSKQITNLEYDLGVQLFDRSNKQMVLTEHGASFYKSSAAILRQISESERRIQYDNERVEGDLKITLSRSLVDSSLSSWLSEFSERYPNVRYRLEYSESIINFSDSDLDFAFRIGEIADSTRLISRELCEVRPTFFATTEYLATHGTPTQISELTSHRVAMPPLEDLSPEVRKWLKNNKFNNQTYAHHRINDVHAIQTMALKNICIGFQLHQSIIKLIESGLVIPLFQNNKLPPKKLSLVYRQSQYKAKQIEVFKRFIFEKYNKE